jgi:regulator of protease activity HflC (stomatin/prohibitin superfamily)
MGELYWIPLGIMACMLLFLILGSFFTVNTAEVAVITRFGKFLRIAEPGLNWKRPFVDNVAGLVTLRVNQITLTGEGIRRLLQVVRSGGPDQVLCGASDLGARPRNDAG